MIHITDAAKGVNYIIDEYMHLRSNTYRFCMKKVVCDVNNTTSLGLDRFVVYNHRHSKQNKYKIVPIAKVFVGGGQCKCRLSLGFRASSMQTIQWKNIETVPCESEEPQQFWLHLDQGELLCII